MTHNHKNDPWLSTTTIYGMHTTCSTKMAIQLLHHQHLYLLLSLFPHFASLNPFPFLLSSDIPFHYPSLLAFSRSLWIVLPTAPGIIINIIDAMNGSFHDFLSAFLAGTNLLIYGYCFFFLGLILVLTNSDSEPL